MSRLVLTLAFVFGFGPIVLLKSDITTGRTVTNPEFLSELDADTSSSVNLVCVTDALSRIMAALGRAATRAR